MALKTSQRRIAEKIDTRMRKLIRAGDDNLAIMSAMADQMPAFHRLLSTARPDDIDQLARAFPGFHRYAKILETLATGIRSGAIPVPGGNEKPFRPTKAATTHRQRAAAMDLRMRQLAEEGVPRSAIIDRMTAHVIDLGEIWNTTSDEQLAALCDEYPGFHAYAALMEEAAEAERRKPARPYDDLPALPDALKEQLASLLGTAARLERDYQAVRDAAGTTPPADWLLPLLGLHAEWEADLTRFRATLRSAGVPRESCDIILPALDQMARRIGGLKTRAEAP